MKRKTYEKIAEKWCEEHGYSFVGVDNVLKGNLMDIQAHKGRTDSKGQLIIEPLTISFSSYGFRKPKDLENYIQIWGWMDDVVTHTKKGKALSYWKKNATPKDESGIEFILNCGGKIRKLKYDDVVCNRYWFQKHFERDMKNYKRLYSVFADVMAM